MATEVYIVCYSMYGHVEKLAEEIKKGAASVEGVEAKLWLTEKSEKWAWKLWTEVGPLDLMDSPVDDLVIQSEIMRCIHVALLCVEQNPDDRPTMSKVVLMLNEESKLRCSSSSKDGSCSVNDFTITWMDDR